VKHSFGWVIIEKSFIIFTPEGDQNQQLFLLHEKREKEKCNQSYKPFSISLNLDKVFFQGEYPNVESQTGAQVDLTLRLCSDVLALCGASRKNNKSFMTLNKIEIRAYGYFC
jgi:hypothetical protein